MFVNKKRARARVDARRRHDIWCRHSVGLGQVPDDVAAVVLVEPVAFELLKAAARHDTGQLSVLPFAPRNRTRS